MQDFVKCLKCGKENMRQDFFLDLPLAIKPFGATSAFSSIVRIFILILKNQRLKMPFMI